MTNPRDDGLKYEVATSFGDSGGGGLIERGDKLYTIGVVSHGYYMNDGFNRIVEWGFIGAYTRTDGAALPWIKANLANLGKNGAQAAEDCEDWADDCTDLLECLPDFNQSPDDYSDPMDIFIDQEDPF